jgi:hypothetical protein
MVQSAFVTLLVSAVSLAPLLDSRLMTAALTAIGVTAVAVRADKEHRTATISPAEPLS